MDQAVYQWFLSVRSDSLSNVAVLWSTIWAPAWVWAYAALLGFFLPEPRSQEGGGRRKEGGRRQVWCHRREPGHCSLSPLCIVGGRHPVFRCVPLISVLVASCCSSLLKRLTGRERPPEPTRIVVENSPAFPSGHAVAAAALAAAVFLFLGARLLSAVLAVNAVAVGLIRLYLGVHWLSDVLAGYAVGILTVWIVFQVIWVPMMRRWRIGAAQ